MNFELLIEITNQRATKKIGTIVKKLICFSISGQPIQMTHAYTIFLSSFFFYLFMLGWTRNTIGKLMNLKSYSFEGYEGVKAL